VQRTHRSGHLVPGVGTEDALVGVHGFERFTRQHEQEIPRSTTESQSGEARVLPRVRGPVAIGLALDYGL
jgi:hypothetical protein